MALTQKEVDELFGVQSSPTQDDIDEIFGIEKKRKPTTGFGTLVDTVRSARESIANPDIENTASSFVAQSTPFSQSLDRTARRTADAFTRASTGLDAGLERPQDNPAGFDVSDIGSTLGTIGGFGVGLIPVARGAGLAVKGTSLAANAGRQALAGGGLEAIKTGIRKVAGQEDRTTGEIAADIGTEAAFFGGTDFLFRGAARLIKERGGNVRKFFKRARADKTAGATDEQAILNGARESGAKNPEDVITGIRQDKFFGKVKEDFKLTPEELTSTAVLGEQLPADVTRGTIRAAGRKVDLFTDDESLRPFVQRLAKGLERGERLSFDEINKQAARKVRAATMAGKTVDQLSDDIAKRLGTVSEAEKQVVLDIAEEKLNHAQKMAIEFAAGKLNTKQMNEAVAQALVGMNNAGLIGTEFGRTGQLLRKAGQGQRAKKAVLETLDKLAGGSKQQEIAYKRLGTVDLHDPYALAEFLRDFHIGSNKDKFLEAWYSFILSSPKTQLVNIVGNTSTMLGRAFLERPTAAALDLARVAGNRAIGRKVARERFFRESFDDLAGLVQGLGEGWRAGVKGFRSEIPQFGVSKFDTFDRRILGKAVKGTKGDILRLPLKALTFADEFFKAINYRSGINILARREARSKGLKSGTSAFNDAVADLIQKPTAVMKKRAVDMTLDAVFQTPLQGTIGKIAGLKGGDDAGAFLANIVLPFVRTPYNIVKYGLARSPLGLANTSQRALRGKLTGGELADEFAKAATGTAVAMGAIMYNRQGLITGGGPPPGTPERKNWLRTNRPYSVKVGDQWISYARLEPLAIAIGLASDYAELSQEGLINPEDAHDKIMRALAFNVTNKTFMQGTAAFLDFIQNDPLSGNRFQEMLIGSAIPNVVAEIARAKDPVQFRRVDSIEESLRSRIPGKSLFGVGLRESLHPVRNIWGEPIIQLDAPGESMYEGFASPVRRMAIVKDETTKEVARLGVMEGLGGTIKAVTFRGIKHELTDQQRDFIEEEAGKRSKQYVESVINSPFYNRMNDEQKKKALEKAVGKARDRVRKEMLRALNQ